MMKVSCYCFQPRICIDPFSIQPRLSWEIPRQPRADVRDMMRTPHSPPLPRDQRSVPASTQPSHQTPPQTIQGGGWRIEALLCSAPRLGQQTAEETRGGISHFTLVVTEPGPGWWPGEAGLVGGRGAETGGPRPGPEPRSVRGQAAPGQHHLQPPAPAAASCSPLPLPSPGPAPPQHGLLLTPATPGTWRGPRSEAAAAAGSDFAASARAGNRGRTRDLWPGEGGG